MASASASGSNPGNVDGIGASSIIEGCGAAVVVHLDDVDQLVGLEAAGRDTPEGRRIRTGKRRVDKRQRLVRSARLRADLGNL